MCKEHRSIIKIFQNIFGRIPLIWHTRDPTGVGLSNVPDYQTQPTIIMQATNKIQL
jgi:hypothetical protein